MHSPHLCFLVLVVAIHGVNSLDIHVSNSHPDAVQSVHHALTRLRQHRDGVVPHEPDQIHLHSDAVHALNEPLTLTKEDSNLIFVGHDNPLVSGGIPVDNAHLVPLDLSRLTCAESLIPPAAVQYVRKFNIHQVPGLASLGYFSVLSSHNGDGFVATERIRQHSAELFFLGKSVNQLKPQTVLPHLSSRSLREHLDVLDDHRSARHSAPSDVMHFARQPNRNPQLVQTQFTNISAVHSNKSATSNSPYISHMESSADAHTDAFVQEFNGCGRKDIWAHGQFQWKWADANFPVVAVSAVATKSNVSVKIPHAIEKNDNPCAGDCDPIPSGSYYYYNALSALDSPGEYVMDHASGDVWVYPPASWQAFAREGAHFFVSNSSMDRLVNVQEAHNITFRGVEFRHGTAAGAIVNNSHNITFQETLFHGFGTVAVNVSGGSNCGVDASTITDCGAGGVILEGGDRAKLIPASHFLTNSTLFANNRWVYTYSPVGPLIAGVGQRVVNNVMHDGPQMALYAQGNDHFIANNSFHDLCNIMHDNGALYTGRDFTYRGNVIHGNVFYNVTSVYDAPRYDSIMGIYMDDRVSSYTMTNNVFVNVDVPLMLGGGREHVFANNVIYPTMPRQTTSNIPFIRFDVRGFVGYEVSCLPSSHVHVGRLALVPYQSKLWEERYGPKLKVILNDSCAMAYYNRFVDNCVVLGQGGIVQKWATSWISVSEFDMRVYYKGELKGNQVVLHDQDCTARGIGFPLL